MKKIEEDLKGKNFKVLDSLCSLFKLLSDHNAIIGRDNARIVVELNKVSFIKHEEIHEIYRESLLVAPNGSMRIFSDLYFDGKTNIFLLNINKSIKDKVDIFSKFPAFNEVKALLESIPLLSSEQSQYFEALHKVLESNIFELTAEHRNELREALFGGVHITNKSKI